MTDLAAPVSRLVDELKRLPGVGSKSAQRMAFHLLDVPREDAERLAQAILEMRGSIQLCERCNNLSEHKLCHFCTDPRREKNVVCVVEHPNDIMAVERTRQYTGQYHVLHGVLSPMKKVGVEDLKLKNLVTRLEDGVIREVIVATSPTSEGQATASYLVRLLKPLGVKLTRIGMGVPVGTELEFVDEATMMEAMEGRREL